MSKVLQPKGVMSAAARGYMAHPKVRVNGSLVLTRPDALLSKEQYDAEVLVYEWALKQVQGNLPRLRDAFARMRPLEFSGDAATRLKYVAARNAFQDAQFREMWLRQGLAHIMRLWEMTKDKIAAIEALKAQALRAQLMEEKQALVAKMAALAAEANKASQEATSVLVSDDKAAAAEGVAPPSDQTEPTDAGVVETVIDRDGAVTMTIRSADAVKETIAAKKAADGIASEDEQSFFSKYGTTILLGVGAGIVLHNVMGRGNR
jgi:hypothetical protein